MRTLAAFIVAAVTIFALAACGTSATPSPSSGGGGAPASAAGGGAPSAAAGGGSASAGAACATAPAGGAATVNVSIKNFSFSPQPVEAKVGDVVAWKNDDSAPHSATMDDNSCDTDSIASGSTAMLVFTAPGTYTYHCKVHPTQMKGFTVEVK